VEITIKMDELFVEDGGFGTVPVSVVLISAIAEKMMVEFRPEVKKEIRAALGKMIEVELDEQLSAAFQEVLNGEFTAADKYGAQRGTTTLRKVIVDELRDSVVALAKPDRNQQSPLVQMIHRTMQELVTGEVREYLAEIKRTTGQKLVDTIRADVEKMR